MQVAEGVGNAEPDVI